MRWAMSESSGFVVDLPWQGAAQLRDPLRRERANRPGTLAQGPGRLLDRQVRVEAEHDGSAFGGRNHATVLHACKRVSERLRDDQQVAAVLAEISELVCGSRADRNY